MSSLPEIYADPTQQAAAQDIDLLDDMEFMMWLVYEETAEDEQDGAGKPSS